MKKLRNLLAAITALLLTGLTLGGTAPASAESGVVAWASGGTRWPRSTSPG